MLFISKRTRQCPERVACLQELSVHQAVGLMACLVWREKSDSGTRVSAELEGSVGALREAAKRVAKVCPTCHLHWHGCF